MNRCIAVLGGSFDPVHIAHVALARHFTERLQADELRLIPAGHPWQKGRLQADGTHRIAMLKLAFAGFPTPVTIDRQEMERGGGSYAIDTVKSLRAELGGKACIAFLIGADQLQRLNTWKEWRNLFDYVHFCVASRPGWRIAENDLPSEVARELANRQATEKQVRTTAHGAILLSPSLEMDVSATAARAALAARGVSPSGEADCKPLDALLPATVLDYIRQQHLYGS